LPVSSSIVFHSPIGEAVCAHAAGIANIMAIRLACINLRIWCLLDSLLIAQSVANSLLDGESEL